MNINLTNITFNQEKTDTHVIITNEPLKEVDSFELGELVAYKKRTKSEVNIAIISAVTPTLKDSDFYKLGETLGRALKAHKRINLEINFDATNLQISKIIENAWLYITPITDFKANPHENIDYNISFVEPKFSPELVITLAKQNANSYQISRVLNNMPHSVCNPDTMVKFIAKNFGQENVKITTYRKRGCLDNQFNGLLALGQGSAYEQAMVKIEYINGKNPKIGLIGKGLTFDMGGYSIKTGKDLSGMKRDMAGCNAVIGAMHTLISNKAKVNVVAYLPITDNLINEHAIIPGDIISYPNGTSVEVLNTDAEGRLVLADALILAEKEGCSSVVDIATLTGAIGAAVGPDFSGYFTNDELIVKDLENASKTTSELIWRMPLHQPYAKTIESKTADINNISTMSTAGSITAALFLQRFAGKLDWCHIDMAPVADEEYLGAPSNGYGTRLLSEFILEHTRTK